MKYKYVAQIEFNCDYDKLSEVTELIEGIVSNHHTQTYIISVERILPLWQAEYRAKEENV